MSDETHQQDRLANAEEARLGNRLREAREYLGLSQEAVAEQLKIPRASISAMETGRRKVSSLELKQLARLYRRRTEYFLEEGDSVLGDDAQDQTIRALFRTTRALNDQDRQQVLRFAQFLRHADRPPAPHDEQTEPT